MTGDGDTDAVWESGVLIERLGSAPYAPAGPASLACVRSSNSSAAIRGSVREVFGAFIALGLTSFGGPAAHLGYFRAQFVERRRWIGEREYADLVALCQFLPGPASSQVGLAIGLLRAGMPGALAAFAGFTLPSAVLMVAFALGASVLSGPLVDGVLTGLKIAAVAVVAQAVWAMSRTLTPDLRRAGIAVASLIAATLFSGSVGQIGALVLGVVSGLVLCRRAEGIVSAPLRFPVRRGIGVFCLMLFGGILVLSPVITGVTGSGNAALFDAFYRAGSLVVGGGHVVLPLLQAWVVEPGWVSDAQFLSGYGAAQAVPGPLFTFAAYLGAISTVGPGGVVGACLALAAVFLPGMLLLIGVLPFWNALQRRAVVQAAMRGAGAAVVGILAAALYAPVFTTAVTGPAAFCLAALCFVLLVAGKAPPWVVVVLGAAGGALLAAW